MYNNYNPYCMQTRFPQYVDNNLQNVPQSATQFTKPMYLLGKSVDNMDVVKAMDIPLDGSISYFPLTDGSAIVSKQLQMDGTSRMVVYKPLQEEKKEDMLFATIEDLQDLQDEIKTIKKQLKEFKDKDKKDKEA